jgi:hypothetical protein
VSIIGNALKIDCILCIYYTYHNSPVDFHGTKTNKKRVEIPLWNLTLAFLLSLLVNYELAEPFSFTRSVDETFAAKLTSFPALF